LALEPGAGAWEALGDAWQGQGDATQAQRCYRNALAMARGEIVRQAPGQTRGVIDTSAIAVEERDEHGVPRLRG